MLAQNECVVTARPPWRSVALTAPEDASNSDARAVQPLFRVQTAISTVKRRGRSTARVPHLRFAPARGADVAKSCGTSWEGCLFPRKPTPEAVVCRLSFQHFSSP